MPRVRLMPCCAVRAVSIVTSSRMARGYGELRELRHRSRRVAKVCLVRFCRGRTVTGAERKRCPPLCPSFGPSTSRSHQHVPDDRSSTRQDARFRSRGRKTRVRAHPGCLDRSNVPAPPRRRRPALTALAVLLIVGGAALAGLLAVRMDSREPVLVVAPADRDRRRRSPRTCSSRQRLGRRAELDPGRPGRPDRRQALRPPDHLPGSAAPDRPAAQEPAPGGRPGPGRRTADVGEVPARPAQRRRRPARAHR